MHVQLPKPSIPEWSTLIGIVTAIVGNVLISIALNIQRYAHIRLNKQRTATKNGATYGTIQQEAIAEERAQLNRSSSTASDRNKGKTAPVVRPLGHRTLSLATIKHSETQCTEEGKQNYLMSPYWWAGILLMTIGEAGNFIAYGFAPASIVSPLGVVALVSNCVIAPFMLNEQFRRQDMVGVLVAVAGAVCVVLSAETSEVKMGPSDIWEAITRWEFELYLGITGAMMITLVWASRRYGEKSILIDLGLVGLFGKFIENKPQDRPANVTVTGGYTALSTKGVASLLSYTLWHALTFPITYLLIAILVATALLQIRYLNKALQRFDSTQVIPTQFVLFTISVIVGSAILYRDFETATLGRVGKFTGGCAMTFAGVYLITSSRGPPPPKNDGNASDEEAEIGLIDEEGPG